jgi:cobalamin synthase
LTKIIESTRRAIVQLIYISQVHWPLLVLTLALVLGFESSASAYSFLCVGTITLFQGRHHLDKRALDLCDGPGCLDSFRGGIS